MDTSELRLYEHSLEQCRIAQHAMERVQELASQPPLQVRVEELSSAIREARRRVGQQAPLRSFEKVLEQSREAQQVRHLRSVIYVHECDIHADYLRY